MATGTDEAGGLLVWLGGCPCENRSDSDAANRSLAHPATSAGAGRTLAMPYLVRLASKSQARRRFSRSRAPEEPFFVRAMRPFWAAGSGKHPAWSRTCAAEF